MQSGHWWAGLIHPYYNNYYNWLNYIIQCYNSLLCKGHKLSHGIITAKVTSTQSTQTLVLEWIWNALSPTSIISLKEQ